MKKIQPFLLLVLLLLGTPKSIFAQVNSYTFASTSGTYTPTTGGTVMGTIANDDQSFNGIALPFSFTYGATVFSHFAVSSNGFISLGTSASISTSTGNFSPLSNTFANNNIIAPLGTDLLSSTTGVLSRITLGIAPARTLVIQWKDYGFTGGGPELMNFQIRLSEGTNTIQFVYGAFSNMPAYFAQVGLRGINIADFKNRITTAVSPSWAATIPGTVNTDTAICEIDTAIFPANGTTFSWTAPAGCTGTPIGGTTNTTSATVCAASNFTLNLTGNTAGAGITYQWQSSPIPIGTYTNIASATTAIYTTTQTASTSYRCLVTCTSSSLSATSVATTVNVLPPTYATVPYVQNFETLWNTTCVVAPLGQDIPDASWRNRPSADLNTGWRADNTTAALSGWGSSPSGMYSPTGANSTTRSARFHSFNTLFGAKGSLDFYVDLSSVGTKQLSFYYIKPSTGGNRLELFISTDGGQNFSALSSTPALVAAGVAVTSWTQSTVILASSSATTVIRFTATGDGVSDLGLDEVNLSVLSSCTGTPTAGTTLASTASTCSGNVTLSLPTASIGSGITYQWQSSPLPAGTYTNITGATSSTYAATQTVGTSYQCVVSCGAANATSAPTDVTMALLANCYCAPVSAGVVCITRVTIGAINNITGCGTAPNFYDAYPNTITTTLTQGISYPITVTTAVAADVSVWIDYNQNGTFDASEWVQAVANATTGTVNITPSFAAIVGTTKMRVRSKTPFTNNTATEACVTFLSGDSEDYFINIASGVVCSTITVTPVSSSPTYTVGVAVNTTLSASSSIVGATYTYSVTAGTLPAGLTFVGNVLSGNPTTVTASGSFTITATSAPGACTGTATYTFNVIASPVCVTAVVVTPVSSSPTYTVGTAVNTVLGASGGPSGTPTYTYSISAGTLPAGLTLASGIISGTPTTATASGTFTVMATSVPSGCTGTATYTYNVLAAPACTTVVIVPASNSPTYTAGTAITNIVLSSTGGVSSTTYNYTISAGTLPAGLILSGNTISGTPTTASTGTFTVTATSVIGNCIGTSTFTFTVNLAASCTAVVVTPTASPLVYTIGTAITNITLGASGGPTTGTPTYTYAVVGLPTGLNFSGNTISGTPIGAPSTGSFTVTATSTPLGCTGSTTYNYTINAAPVCTTVTVTPATSSFIYTIGTAIPTITFGASGGAVGATYAYSVSALPSGLTFTGTTVVGTPTGAASTGSFTVTATSTPLGCTGSTTYNYTILAPLVCSTVIVTPPNGFRNYTVGTPITPINFSATGGVTGATYTYVVTGLPAWATRVGNTISGTPTATGFGSFTIQATSTPGNCIGSSTISFNPLPGIVCASPVVLTPAATTLVFTAGVPITNVIFSATGGPIGTPTYSYNLFGTLPAGLTFSGNIISGTPLAPPPGGSGFFSVEVTTSPGNCFATSNFNFVVNLNPACATQVLLTSFPTNFVSFTQGTPITNIVMNAIGGPAGAATYVYTVVGLPGGLTFASNTISGTPLLSGFGTFDITTTSTPGNCVSINTINYFIAPSAACTTPIAITPPFVTIPTFTVGIPLTPIVLGITGGPAGTPTYVYTITAGALPAGVTLVGNIISGTPTTTSNPNFCEITATSTPSNCTGNTVLTYNVINPSCTSSITLNPPSGGLSAYTVGTPVPNIIFNASGGVAGATYAYSISAGALPVGITLVGNTLSGTPTTAGSGTFTIRVISTPGGCTTTSVFTYFVNPNTTCPTAVVVSPVSSSPIYAIGTAIPSITLSATGGPTGIPTYTYTISAGILPLGITLLGNIISGTPTTIGSGTFTVRATSSPSGCTGTSTFTYNVVANPSCPTAVSITPATTTFAYIQSAAITNVTLSASGGPTGTPTYTYAVSAGALPAGVTLSSAGLISGTPTTVGNGSFVVIATASTGGCSGTVTYNYSVSGVASVCQTAVSITPIGFATTYTAGTAITNITLGASGGPAGATTYSYTISAGVLPAGVTLVGNVISGTPTTLTTTGTFTIRATTSVGNCAGTATYRFNVLDNPTTSIDNNLSNLVKVSPNPSNSDFNVDFGNINLAKATVRVYDAQGKQVFASDVNTNLMTISLGNFASGIYLLEVETSKGRILKRLSKN